MVKRNLLLCFDAFGTLFRPKQTVAIQYCEVARQYGVSGFSEKALESSFLAAVKAQMKAHPIYGRSSGMGSTKWWTTVSRRLSYEGFEAYLPLVRSYARRSHL